MKKIFVFILIFISSGISAQEKIADEAKLCALISEMKITDQFYRNGDVLRNWNTDKNSKKEIDSVWALQLKIDNSNTEKLIELTKKYGWLSNERLECEFKHYLFLIFRHSQDEYFDEISELIDKELDASRLNVGHYKIIRDHLNGRPRQ